MNYGKKGTKNKLNSINSQKQKYVTKMFLNLFKIFLVVTVFVIFGTAFAGFGMIKGILDNSPSINDINVVPTESATTIYDSSGTLIETLVASGSNRDPVTYSQIPQDLINSVIAIEDERFWSHNGIDPKGIVRVFLQGIATKDFNAGASTITQQLIKNSVFEGGSESSLGARVERKVQEQYLAIQLEKTMDKTIILENYLNTINLGNNTLGVQAAAKRYFNKDVWDLTLSECTVLAGITQNPTGLNPITNPEKNQERRLSVIKNMLRLGYITEEQKTEILEDDVYSRIQTANASYIESDSPFSYYTDELIEQVMEDLKLKKGYTQNQAYNLLYKGGLSIYTPQDAAIQSIVDEEISDPDNYTLIQYSISYRLSVTHEDGTTEHFSEIDIRNHQKDVLSNVAFTGLYKNEEAINEAIDQFKAYILKESDKVIGEKVTTTLQPQASFVIMDQVTGYVRAISGGRGEKTGSLTLNRATNTVRQPGSAFKTLVAFGPAIDTCGATLGTVYYDAPYTVYNKSIANWWGASYAGYANIRQGLIYSMNIVATKALMETVTEQLGFEYAQSFGITTLVEKYVSADGTVKSDITAALALGGLTNGVSNLELTAAYAAIANGGVYTEPVFYTKILDSNGKVLLSNEPETHRVIKESTAFLLTDAMSDSMKSSTLVPGLSINSTGAAAAIPNMSNAGKSGTTTSNNDIWFVGYSPYYTAGIWAGYDDNQGGLPRGSTSFHKAIWKKIMTRVHEGLSDPGFSVPSSIETAVICSKSGKLAIDGVCNSDPRGSTAYTEYFAKGTVPTEVCDHHIKVTVCRTSGLLAGTYCPESEKESHVYMIVPEDGSTTNDSAYTIPAGLANSTCNMHTPGNFATTKPPITDE